jgi:hypothetical protein
LAPVLLNPVCIQQPGQAMFVFVTRAFEITVVALILTACT